MLLSKHCFQITAWLILMFTSSLAMSCPICNLQQLKYGAIAIEEQCMDIGGYQLYMQLAGKTGPTIIFESGLGDASWVWDKVIPQVAKFAHTLSYDRNGLGQSQTKPQETQPRTAQQAVDNLRTLLAKAHINPPYILVGHSLGGLYMQLYAQLYPQEVAAVVLVDSATREQHDFALPPEDSNYYLEAKGITESIEQLKKAPAFPAVPLHVLTSGQRGKPWLKLQKGLLKLSTQSQQIVTQDSGHFIQREQPDLLISVLENLLHNDYASRDPIQLVRSFIEARNNHDIAAALRMFDDEVKWRTSWGELIEGKEPLKVLLEQQFKDNIHNEIVGEPHLVADNKIKLLRQASMNSWKKLGIDYLLEDSEITVKNGKIILWKNHYTPQSAAKLEQAKKTPSPK